MSAPVWEDPRVTAGMGSQLELLDSRLGAGERLLGWKLGLGGSSPRARLGITGPVVAFITDATAPGGPELGLAGLAAPAVEAEVCLIMAAGLDPGAGREQARRAIAGAVASFELVDIDPELLGDLEAVVAGGIFHRGATFAADAPTPVEQRLAATIHPPTGPPSAVEPLDAVGDLVDLALHTASYLAAFGRRLEAGQVLMTGMLAPPIAVSPGDSLRLELGPERTMEGDKRGSRSLARLTLREEVPPATLR